MALRRPDKEHFDAYAVHYRELLDRNLRLTGDPGVAFTIRRMEFLRRRLPLLPGRVMDFGCGIGLAIPHLLRAFPGCEVTALDVSPESVRLAREGFSGERVRVCLHGDSTAGDFDLVYASGVFHHVAPERRERETRFVFQALRPGGVLALSEHNPWNPLTRYMVRTCPFDTDARLLRPAEAARLLTRAGFRVLSLDYVSFFAGPLRGLVRFEPWLGWLPAGAQYMVIARRD